MVQAGIEEPDQTALINKHAYHHYITASLYTSRNNRGNVGNSIFYEVRAHAIQRGRKGESWQD